MTIRTALIAAILAAPVAAQTPDETAFRGLYKELVETDTSLSAGSCTAAAGKMAARLQAAGFKDADITLFSAPDHPREGGLVAVLPGSDPAAKAILLLGHLDVVEARRADWTRDPFVLVEENGYFYGRGTYDDKAQAAIWTDTLIRYRQAGRVPRRTLKLALTCGEETTTAFNGADWLARHEPALIAAEFALNEGGAGRNDAAGKHQNMGVQVGEKAVQNYQLEAVNRGGHSSLPRPDNAITDLAAAIVKVNTHEFPVQFNATTRTFFTTTAGATSPPVAAAIKALLADPGDAAASALLSKDPLFHSTLRTTCVTTLVAAGHASNALAQRATANVNCRLFPGTDPQKFRAELDTIIGNPLVAVTLTPPVRPVAMAPPLDRAIIGPMQALAARHFPGVPFTPLMSTGGTDAVYLGAIGIPTYGAPGLFIDADGNGAHGLNERIGVKSLMDSRAYLADLIHALAD